MSTTALSGIQGPPEPETPTTFDVYCDETNPDFLTSRKPRAPYLLIGGLWLPARLRNDVKRRIAALRAIHGAWGEIKWRKAAPNRRDFYLALVDLFAAEAELRFRCVAIRRDRVDTLRNDHDAELGFYKFYFQLIHHWIMPPHTYRIFCDVKSTRDPARLPVLARCLSCANASARVAAIQSLPSREVVLIQLCDLLLGAAAARINGSRVEGAAKRAVLQRLESLLGRPIAPTGPYERKFNVFEMFADGFR